MSSLRLKENPTLADLQAYIAQAVKERGFQDDIPQCFMLLLEEAGEFAKAARKHTKVKFAADTEHKDLSSEAADVLSLLLGICNLLNVDLEQAFRDKEEHNKQRVWK